MGIFVCQVSLPEKNRKLWGTCKKMESEHQRSGVKWNYVKLSFCTSLVENEKLQEILGRLQYSGKPEPGKNEDVKGIKSWKLSA